MDMYTEVWKFTGTHGHERDDTYVRYESDVSGTEVEIVRTRTLISCKLHEDFLQEN